LSTTGETVNKELPGAITCPIQVKLSIVMHIAKSIFIAGFKKLQANGVGEKTISAV